MSQTAEIFSAFEANGVKALDIIRKRVFTPDLRKTLRTWGITEACEMVGRSVQTIRELEKAKKIPSPSVDSSTNRRIYTLEHINKLREYFGTKPSKPQNSDPAIIAFANFKGGVTKSTSSINSAHFFALQGYKTLFIDCDSQATATQCFGYIPDNDIDENQTLLPYLRGHINDLNAVIQKTYWGNLDLIPANLSLYSAEFELPVKHMQEGSQGFDFFDIIRQGIETIKNNYDIIILDCPPSLGMISINAVYAANFLIVPVPPSMLDFSSTIQFFGMLKDVLTRLPEKNYASIKLLITKYENSDNSRGLIDIIRQLFGSYVQTAMVPVSEAIKKASTEMKSIYEIDKYAGAKKTLDRIRQSMDEVNSELESTIKSFWGLNEAQARNV
ncbi:MAG: AAA family ATPase [Gammaproteobacteria bacterium]|nr:AAA family ATPase [Gammaproteobacteria bacterium]